MFCGALRRGGYHAQYRCCFEDLFYVGASDRRLSLFENVYPVPRGASYNSYLLLDEKTALFDTVDHAVSEQFLENVEHVLGAGSSTISSSITWSPITLRRFLKCSCATPKPPLSAIRR